MNRAAPLPNFEAVAIKCPACHPTGGIIVDAGPVRPSTGFVFDAITVPTCEVCCIPAGLWIEDLASLPN